MKRWTIVAGLVAAAALLPGDAPAPRRTGGRILAHAPESAAPSAPFHASVSPSRIDRRARETGRASVPGHVKRESKAGATALATPAPGAGGRIVALDPETGQLGEPSADQMRALRSAAGIAALSRSDEGLVETRLTDGTVILDLDGRFQDHVVARLDRNGRLTYGCVHDDGKKPVAPGDTASSALEEK